MVLETDKTTIDSQRLLEKTSSNLIKREKALAEMPLPLDASKIPSTEALKPSQLEPDPLRLRKLFPSSFASFKIPDTISSRIFNLNAAPSIGDQETIAEYSAQIKKASAAPKQELEVLNKMFKELENIEKNLQDIKNRLNEFVLG